MDTHDALVIGGGMVGAAIGWGLQRRGLETAMLDEPPPCATPDITER